MNRKFLTAVLLCLPASLSWAVSEGLEDGSNNFRGGAVAFTVPDTLTGTLGNDGATDPPQDYFKWDATAGVSYSFNATSSGLPQLDLAFDIENSAGVSQTPGGLGIDAAGAGGAESYTFAAPTTGTYYIVLWRADTTATGASYSVSVQSLASVDNWELY